MGEAKPNPLFSCFSDRGHIIHP